jgi:porin
MQRVLATGGVVAALVAVPSLTQAQAINSGVGIGPSLQVAQPSAETNVAPTVEHLFGDVGGVRTKLEDHSIYLLLDATTEFASNVSGGVKRGATFANQVGFEADMDWQRLAGITGLSTHVIMVNRSGSNDSRLFGDNFLPVQEIYGSGGNVAVHLVSAYAQEVLYGGKLDLTVGRMNVENDFASSPLYCNFMNNALCGDPKALPGGDIGHSAYPDSVWAARVRVHPIKEIYVETGIYEVNHGLYSDANFRSGLKFDGSQDSGVYVPVELAYEPLVGSAKLPGHYKIGFGYDSSSTYKAFSLALIATSDRMSGAPISMHTGNTQSWVLFDQMLLRQGPGDQDGIIALGGLVHNDPANSVYAEQYFAGVLDRGFWRGRPQDAVGMLFTYNTLSAVLSKVQSREAALGIPLSNAATGPQTHEMVLELNYDIHVTRGVNIQPEFQYVFRPNAQSNIHDAAVFGFKGHVEF